MLWKLKDVALTSLLVAIAIVGPIVAYAGVSVIYPTSTQTVNINTSPPITFASGADFTLASSLGFGSSFATADNAASFSVTLSGLSGGTLTVDDYSAITASGSISSYKVQIASALAGSLSTPTTLKIRLWTGATPPTADGDAQVCAVLDLKAALNTESSTACSASSKIQIVYVLPSASTGSSAVSIRPSSIVFA